MNLHDSWVHIDRPLAVSHLNFEMLRNSYNVMKPRLLKPCTDEKCIT